MIKIGIPLIDLRLALQVLMLKLGIVVMLKMVAFDVETGELL